MPKKKRAPKKRASRRSAPVSRTKVKAKRRSNPRRCNMCRGTGKLKSKRNNPCPMCKGNGYVGVQRNPGETVGAFQRRMHTTIEIKGHEEVVAAEEEEEEEQAKNPTGRQVILSPVDSPSGKIAVHVLDRNHQLVRPLEGGPVTYYSVQKARADCEAAGLEVVSEFSEENPRRRRNSPAVWISGANDGTGRDAVWVRNKTGDVYSVPFRGKVLSPDQVDTVFEHLGRRTPWDDLGGGDRVPCTVKSVIAAASETSNPRRRNPPAGDAAAQRAHFEKLHWGDPPTGPVKLDCPDYKDASAVLGRLVKVEYVASKGGRTYTWVHKHLAPAYLVVTKRGKLLIGEPEGKKSYIVTAAGIEG
jgi:hypothetical protein